MLRPVILVCGLLGLAACQLLSPPAKAPAGAADASIHRSSDVFFAEASFPPQLASIAPQLDARLRADALAEFAAVEADARQYREADPDYFRPYRVGITWDLIAASGPLISLQSRTFYDTGGAHPNHVLGGLVHNCETGEDIPVLSLFEDDPATRAALTGLLRAEVLRLKQERYGEAGLPAGRAEAEVAELFDGPHTWFANAALASSTREGRFGGLTVFFSPYEIGTYAEGAYRATLPQSAFRDRLKPQHRPLFTGEPVPPRGA